MQTSIDWAQADKSGPHFGDPERELRAAMEGAALCPLAHFGLLRFLGADTAEFLQEENQESR